MTTSSQIYCKRIKSLCSFLIIHSPVLFLSSPVPINNNKTILNHQMPRQKLLVRRGTKMFLFQSQKHQKYLEKSFIGFTWQGRGGGRLQRWLLQEDTRSCSHVRQVVLQEQITEYQAGKDLKGHLVQPLGKITS